MKKFILTSAFLSLLANPCLAEGDASSLSKSMEDKMVQMAASYADTMGKELQLRAIDLYLMGEGLLNHPKNPKVQAGGKKAIELAENLYNVGKELSRGEEVTVGDMKDWVNRWTVK